MATSTTANTPASPDPKITGRPQQSNSSSSSEDNSSITYLKSLVAQARPDASEVCADWAQLSEKIDALEKQAKQTASASARNSTQR